MGSVRDPCAVKIMHVAFSLSPIVEKRYATKISPAFDKIRSHVEVECS